MQEMKNYFPTDLSVRLLKCKAGYFNAAAALYVCMHTKMYVLSLLYSM